jgi:hypothetical protein
MPEFCTCGVELATDSLFCHKCGKPQREMVEPETAPPVAPHAEFVPLTPPAPPQSLPLNFHNPVAVRVAFIVALAANLLSWVPVVNLLLWVAAGFFAVFFYGRRTGCRLNVKAGMRMGWITGVMMFVITTVIFTLTIIPVAASGGISATLRSQSQFKNLSDPKVQDALKMLDTGPGLAAFLLAILVMLFILITLLSMAGGALGAKMTGRDDTASGSSA